VHDAGFMDRGECGGGTGGQGVQAGPGQRPASGHVLVEGGTWYKSGGKPRSGRIGVGIDHRNEAGARNTLGQLDLPPEPSTELVVGGLRRMHDLDGHPLPGGTERGIHGAHAAGPESAHDAMGADTTRITLLHRLNTAGHGCFPLVINGTHTPK
jgi:hypothetical protein